MEQEQIDLLLRAAKVLQDKKEFYDYMVVILPVATALLGWFASIWWQSNTFKKSTRKEHYYVARDKVESVSDSYNEFLAYVYNFYKKTKNTINVLGVVEGDVLNDFITEYQFMLASIHQKLKIIFPGRRFPTEEITKEMKILEKSIIEMNDLALTVRDSKPDMNDIHSRVKDLNKKNSMVILNITTKVSKIENDIITILNNKAEKLGIKDF